MRISDWSSDVCSSDLLAPHLFHIIAADLRHRAIAGVGQAERLRLRGVALRGGDPAVAMHFVQHEIAPCERLLRILGAAIGFGRLGQDGEEGHFVERELVDILVEIGAARRLNPEAAPAERSEEHTSELQSLMRISYAVFSL